LTQELVVRANPLRPVGLQRRAENPAHFGPSLDAQRLNIDESSSSMQHALPLGASAEVRRSACNEMIEQTPGGVDITRGVARHFATGHFGRNVIVAIRRKIPLRQQARMAYRKANSAVDQTDLTSTIDDHV
jgi:hypothetical protein